MAHLPAAARPRALVDDAFYGVASLDEARAYLAHPVLGPRLDLATRAVLSAKGRSLKQIFGSPDDLKFHSSMTLFAQATSAESNPYREALARWSAAGWTTRH